MSDEKKKQDVESVLSSFAVTGPDNPDLVKSEMEIEVQSVLGARKDHSGFKPTVMLTVRGQGRIMSFPLPVEYARKIGTDLIESAITAENDALFIELGVEKGVPLRELFDTLHAIAVRRNERDDERYTHG